MLDALSARVGLLGLLLSPLGVVGLLVGLLLSPLGVVGLLGGLLPDVALREGDLALREARERLPAPSGPYTLPMILVAWADI
jgi:hypothetical protein